jgi:hypothetical protein
MWSGLGRCERTDFITFDAHKFLSIPKYWSTHENDDTARQLYDKLAAYSGLIRYDYKL